jgi:hypothetical protein
MALSSPWAMSFHQGDPQIRANRLGGARNRARKGSTL